MDFLLLGMYRVMFVRSHLLSCDWAAEATLRVILHTVMPQLVVVVFCI